MVNIKCHSSIPKVLSALKEHFKRSEKDACNEEEFHFLNLAASLLATKGHICQDLGRYKEAKLYYDGANQIGPIREKVKNNKKLPLFDKENCVKFSLDEM